MGAGLTWGAFALVLVLFAARAWVVETSSRGRFSTTGARQRTLTAAAAGALVLLVVALLVNGGIELADLLSRGKADTSTPSDVAPVTPGGEAVAPPPPGGP